MEKHRHRYHSWVKRGFFSFFMVAAVMVIGTVGMHRIEKMPWVLAFYTMSMIATAQGSPQVPVTDAGLIFSSVMAFLSVGIVVAALGFLFGPFFGELWHIGVHRFEERLEHLHKKKHE